MESASASASAGDSSVAKSAGSPQGGGVVLPTTTKETLAADELVSHYLEQYALKLRNAIKIVFVN